MIRMPKTLVALVMTFALFVQASAGCVCAISCLLGTCGSHSQASHHEHSKADGGCCEHEKQANADHHTGLNNGHESGHQEQCSCPAVTSCDSVPTTATTANLSYAPVFHFLAILPEPIELSFPMIEVQKPGHFGNDSGPPHRLPLAFRIPRAPPVA